MPRDQTADGLARISASGNSGFGQLQLDFDDIEELDAGGVFDEDC